MESGSDPAVNASMADSTPLPATEYAETVVEPVFATYTKCPSGFAVTELGEAPVAIVPMPMSAPVVASIKYSEMLFVGVLVEDDPELAI